MKKLLLLPLLASLSVTAEETKAPAFYINEGGGPKIFKEILNDNKRSHLYTLYITVLKDQKHLAGTDNKQCLLQPAHKPNIYFDYTVQSKNSATEVGCDATLPVGYSYCTFSGMEDNINSDLRFNRSIFPTVSGWSLQIRAKGSLFGRSRNVIATVDVYCMK